MCNFAKKLSEKFESLCMCYFVIKEHKNRAKFKFCIDSMKINSKEFEYTENVLFDEH